MGSVNVDTSVDLVWGFVVPDELVKNVGSAADWEELYEAGLVHAGRGYMGDTAEVAGRALGGVYLEDAAATPIGLVLSPRARVRWERELTTRSYEKDPAAQALREALIAQGRTVVWRAHLVINVAY